MIMAPTYKITSPAFLFSLIFLCSACAVPRQPVAPNKILDKRPGSGTVAEVNDFADSVASLKKKQNSSVAKAAARDEKAALSKIKDPAWKAIRSKKLDASKPLALVELLDMALRNNPKTRQAWESTRLARAQEKQTESKLYPQVNITETFTREKSDANIPGNDIDDLHYGPAAKMTYLVFNFGGRGFSIKEMVELVSSADALYNQGIQDLILNVEQGYYGLYSASSALEAANSDVDNAKQDYDAAKEKFIVGLVSKLDVLQSQSNYEDSLYKLEDAKGNLELARSNLAQVIGVAADTSFEIADPAEKLPDQVSKNDITLLIEEALKKRPDIASFKAQWRSKKAASRAAMAGLFPYVNVGGSASKNNFKYYGAHKIKEDDHGYSGYAQVSWDIFDGFYNLNKKRQAARERNIAFEQLIQAELALSAEVWTAYYNYNTAVQKLVFSESYLASSQESYFLALESYNAGLKSMLDLTQAQAQLSGARSRLIQSKEAAFIALANLAHSTGSLAAKDFNPQVNLDTEEGKR